MKVFPVHDWLLNEDGMNLTHTIAENVLGSKNIKFIPLANKQTKEF